MNIPSAISGFLVFLIIVIPGSSNSFIILCLTKNIADLYVFGRELVSIIKNP